MHARLPNSTFVRVPDVGHLVTEERPEAVDAALRSFLDDLDPWGGPGPNSSSTAGSASEPRRCAFIAAPRQQEEHS